MKFCEKSIEKWEDLLGELRKFQEKNKKKCFFRGQTSDWRLETKFERELNDLEISLEKAPKIEKKLIREFRRCYDGLDRDLVINDTLYCLALMQHHGAPTRLLDCTYSPFVAAHFALEVKPKMIDSKKEIKPTSVIWCFNHSWCDKQSKNTVTGKKKNLIMQRIKSDKAREDVKSKNNFQHLYMQNAQRFIAPENPILLNRRLIIQRGIFLCPGDVSHSFEDNLKTLNGWNRETSILKLRLEFANNSGQRIKARRYLYDMNVDNATLFPGLDGFAQSFRFRLPFLDRT